jgi:hypothetical protein
MRIRPHKIIVLATAAVAFFAVGGIAFAVNNVSHTSLGFTPSKVPKNTFKGGALKVHTDTVFADPGDKANGGFTKRVQIFFDDDFKFTTTSTPKCAGNFPANTTLKLAMQACGTAKIGSGTASTAPPANIPGCVLAFNGKPQNAKPTIVLFTRVWIPGPSNCANPATNSGGTTSVTLTGVLKPNPSSMSADYTGGKMLDVDNIDSAPLPLDDFTATVKRGNYVSARCHDANKLWQTTTKHTYSGGPPSPQPPNTVIAKKACTVG